MNTKFLLIVAALLLTSLLVGCNMLKGAGQDLENTGENIQETVD